MEYFICLGHAGGCGVTDDITQWMDRIQNSAVDADLPPPIPVLKSKNFMKEKDKLKQKPNDKPKKLPLIQPSSPPPPAPSFEHESPYDKYSREANEVPHSRTKRRIREDRNTCSLYIQTDPLIWKHIREGFPEVMIPSFITYSSYRYLIRVTGKFIYVLNYINQFISFL